MKKFMKMLAMVVAVAMMFSITAFAVNDVDSTEMTKNSSNRQNVLIIDWPEGYEVAIGCSPVIKDNDVLVPLNEFMTVTDYKVLSEDEKNIVTISNGNREITLTANSKNAVVDEKETTLDKMIYSDNDLLYISIEDLEKLFSYEVSYDSKNNNVVLTVTDKTPKAIKTITPSADFVIENESDIKIYNNGSLIELSNKPFVKYGVVYLPLRELFEKLEIVNNTDSYINWDNGKIEILATEIADNKNLSYHYGIEIDKSEYTLNPGNEEMYQSKWGVSNTKKMTNSPILIDSRTYIPFEYVEYMINRSMQYTKIELIKAE